jgi:EAL domain-containing protein (putative c-di-GMP-specific phosphodiesterase class I)
VLLADLDADGLEAAETTAGYALALLGEPFVAGRESSTLGATAGASLFAHDIVAAEALLRRRHPERGAIPPRRFIPAAEQTGLIGPLGDWVLDAACAQARAWHDTGLEIAVSFNASLRQFRDEAFARRLGRRIARHGVPPAKLIVEVTETTAMREARCVEPVLDELKELGVQVAIDDFGTGHSSLGRLRDMAVDMLKLDGSFLPRTAGDARAAGLVRAALALVDALGMSAVAEGVETREQLELLLELDCRLAQGFHLARPGPPGELGVA